MRIESLILSMLGINPTMMNRHRNLGRFRTQDSPAGNAFQFRMNTGFGGDVNRTHPATVEQALIDATNPPTFFGQGVIADAGGNNGVRVPAAGDSGLTNIYGITVRPFPFQASTATNYGATTFGGEAPPATGIIDVLRSGYIIVPFQGAAAATKGGAVKLCIVAGTGYVVGGFSADTVSGTFISLDSRTTFNGPAGADGFVELAFNI